MSDKNKRYRITLTEKQLSLIGHAADMMLATLLTGKFKKDELEYETIYSAIKKYETDRKLNVGKCYPVQCGEEPVPEIERVEE